MLQELLESHVMDPKNAYKCYDLATEYDRLEQGAMGVSLYLKAADLSNDKLLQYKSMIGLALIYYRQGRRDFTVEGGLLDAVALCPERPEAHYHLCAYYEHKANWKHCLAHANTALAFLPQYDLLTVPSFDDPVYELDYKGPDWLYFYRALSTW